MGAGELRLAMRHLKQYLRSSQNQRPSGVSVTDGTRGIYWREPAQRINRRPSLAPDTIGTGSMVPEPINLLSPDGYELDIAYQRATRRGGSSSI